MSDQRIIDWPVNFAPAECEFWPVTSKLTSTSPFGGQMQNLILGPDRWSFSVATPPFRKERLPKWEAFVLRLRSGINLVRVWDWRYTGLQNLGAGVDLRIPGNMVRNSIALSEWQRVGPAPVTSGTGIAVSATSDFYAPNVFNFVAGRSYILVCDLHAAASAPVSLSLSHEIFGEATGVMIDAFDGSVLETFGPVQASGRVALPGGGYRSWMTATAVKSGPGLVHLYPVLPSGNTVSVTLNRPQLAYAMAPLPPDYTPTTTGEPEFGELAPRVDGAGQTGELLNTKGWIPGLVLREGYWLAWGDGMHRVLQDATVDNTGKAQLWVFPPIRLSPADNTAIDYRRVRGLFQLTTENAGFRQKKSMVQSRALDFLEYFTS